MAETIQGIRAIKMYAWEESFYDRISTMRQRGELASIEEVCRLWSSPSYTCFANYQSLSELH